MATWICGVCISVSGKKVPLETLEEIIDHLKLHLKKYKGNSAKEKMLREEELRRLISWLKYCDFFED